ncbi:MAG: spore cortex biosynthesis protein YabQ [Clostridium sp.]
MIFSMPQQVNLFVFSLLSGILIGVLFDIYRTIRGFESLNKLISAIEDVLFWILTGIVIFIFMMYTSYAYMSFNVFVYIGIGLFLYLKAISKFFVKTLHNFLLFIFKVIRVTFYVISYPIRACFYKILRKS